MNNTYPVKRDYTELENRFYTALLQTFNKKFTANELNKLGDYSNVEKIILDAFADAEGKDKPKDE